MIDADNPEMGRGSNKETRGEFLLAGERGVRDVMATENYIAGTLISFTELTDADGKTVRLTLCDDGEKLEVAATYLGVGTRVCYQGQLLVSAVRIYNDLLTAIAATGFTGDLTPVDGIAASEAVLANRSGR